MLTKILWSQLRQERKKGGPVFTLTDPLGAPEKNQISLTPQGRREKDTARRETQKLGQTQTATGAQSPSSWNMWPVMCHFLITHTRTHTFLLTVHPVHRVCVPALSTEPSVCSVLSWPVVSQPLSHKPGTYVCGDLENPKCVSNSYYHDKTMEDLKLQLSLKSFKSVFIETFFFF